MIAALAPGEALECMILAAEAYSFVGEIPGSPEAYMRFEVVSLDIG